MNLRDIIEVSRSIHKTVKGVFGGKSKSTINSMIVENDLDIEDLGKKHSYKSEVRKNRKTDKQTKHFEQE